VSGPGANDPYYGSEVPASSTPQGSSTQGTGRGTATTGSGSVDRAIAKQAAKPDPTETYQEDDILGAAESVFGRGAEGLAKAIEDI
jgi:hypothetical protein